MSTIVRSDDLVACGSERLHGISELIRCLRESMNEENGPFPVSTRLSLSVVYADLIAEPY